MGLIVQRASVNLGARAVLREVSLSPAPGRMLGIVGPNGAGKTTLLRLMLGLVRPDSGDVTLDDRSVADLAEPDRARRMALIPQRSEVAFAFTSREVVRLGTLGARRLARDNATREALELAGASSLADTPFQSLSAGQQQRVILARALAQAMVIHAGGHAPILLADEPAAALDPLFAGRSLELLRSQALQGASVVVVLHDLTLASTWCHDAAVLRADGTLTEPAPVEQALDPALLERSFGVPFIAAALRGRRGPARVVIADHTPED